MFVWKWVRKGWINCDETYSIGYLIRICYLFNIHIIVQNYVFTLLSAPASPFTFELSTFAFLILKNEYELMYPSFTKISLVLLYHYAWKDLKNRTLFIVTTVGRIVICNGIYIKQYLKTVTKNIILAFYTERIFLTPFHMLSEYKALRTKNKPQFTLHNILRR